MRIKIGLLLSFLACVVQAGYAAEISVNSYSWLPGYAPSGHYAADAAGPRVDPEVDPYSNAWGVDFISYGVVGELTDGIYPSTAGDVGSVGFCITNDDGARLFFDLGSVKHLGACTVTHNPWAAHFGDGFGDVTFRFSSLAAPNVTVFNESEWSAPVVRSTAYPDQAGTNVETVELFGNSGRWVYVVFDGSAAPYGYAHTWNVLGEIDFYDAANFGLTDQPVDVEAVQGETVQFSVGVAGNPPFTYQWKKNGVNLSDVGRISGATSETLTISDVQLSDADPDYACAVSNAENPGGLESDSAALTVVAAPALTSYGQRVVATGPVVYYSFDEGSGNTAAELVSLDIGKFLASTTPVHTAHGVFGSAVDTSAGNATDHPTRTNGTWLNPSTGLATVEGPYAVEFMMRWNGADLSGNVLRSPTDDVTVEFGKYDSVNPETYGLVFQNNTWRGTPAASFSTCVSEPDYLGWRHFVFVDRDEPGLCDLYIDGVQYTPFSWVDAAETSRMVLYDIRVGGWAHPTYGRAFRGEIDEVAYYDLTDEADLDATAAVIASHAVNTGAAYVVRDPQNTAVNGGGTAEFRCVAAGAPDITYQWKKGGVDLTDGGDISGATTPVLNIANVESDLQGTLYSCAVSNGEGGATSAQATLVVECFWDIPGDLDDDCDEDLDDLGIFAENWLADSTVHALPLASQGQTDAVIVVAEQATLAEKYAADELSHFLHEMTGADFVIVAQAPADTLCLLVGPDAARMVEPDFSVETLGFDAIRIKTRPNALILAGPRPRGTLYAVYCFLERLGCRWWSSTVATIPQQATLGIDNLDITYVPPLEYRTPYSFDAFKTDFAARNRCNGENHDLDEAHGGKEVYAGFVHTFYALIPPGTYFNDHPEWFSMIDGQREYESAQLCLTNDAMREELTNNLRALLLAHPDATIASVSQNDCQGFCTCPPCAALDAQEGSHAGSLLHFVNAVAADIEQEFPNVAISTLAYQYTRTRPNFVRPRSNVIIRLCSIECSFSQPLDHVQNAAFANDIRSWAAIADRLNVWDYTTNFLHYQLPHPNLRVLGPNIKFFVQNNVKGVMEQGCGNTNGGEFAELRGWVLAQLLWDPSRDADELIDEFLSGYYGPAGPHIRTYIDIVHDAVEVAVGYPSWMQHGYYLQCFVEPTAAFITYDTLARGYVHLAAAEQAVKNDPDLLFRVQCAQMPILYTFLMRWNDFQAAAQASDFPWPLAQTPQAVFDEFAARFEANNMTRLSEGTTGLGPLIDAMP